MHPTVQAAILTGVGTIALAIIGGAISIARNVTSNKKAHKEFNSRFDGFNNRFDSKVGSIDSGSLSKQHEDIKEVITSEAKSIKESQDDKFNRVQNVVDKINDSVIRTETKYNNLEPNQREINDKVQALLTNWQSVISENKELRKEIEYLKEQNKALVDQNTKLIDEMQSQEEMKSKDDPEDEWDLEV